MEGPATREVQAKVGVEFKKNRAVEAIESKSNPAKARADNSAAPDVQRAKG